MTRGSMWSSIKDLGAPGTLHRFKGYISTGGHHMHVFEPAESVDIVVRPWQSDMSSQANEGMTGQTPGIKVYPDPAADLDRDDRIVFRDEHFRIQNPQYDQTFGIERWDGQEDEREFRLYGNLDDALKSELEPPESGGGNY